MIESLITWLIIGGVAGWLGGLIVKGYGFGLVGNIVIGIIGAVIAGWLLPMIGVVIGGGIIAAIIDAVIGRDSPCHHWIFQKSSLRLADRRKGASDLKTAAALAL